MKTSPVSSNPESTPVNAHHEASPQAALSPETKPLSQTSASQGLQNHAERFDDLIGAQRSPRPARVNIANEWGRTQGNLYIETPEGNCELHVVEVSEGTAKPEGFFGPYSFNNRLFWINGSDLNGNNLRLMSAYNNYSGEDPSHYRCSYQRSRSNVQMGNPTPPRR